MGRRKCRTTCVRMAATGSQSQMEMEMELQMKTMPARLLEIVDARS